MFKTSLPKNRIFYRFLIITSFNEKYELPPLSNLLSLSIKILSIISISLSSSFPKPFLNILSDDLQTRSHPNIETNLHIERLSVR